MPVTHVTYGSVTRELKPDRPVTVHLDPDDTAWTPTGDVAGPGTITYIRNTDDCGTVSTAFTPGDTDE